jgi:hypothetical protein
MILPSTPLALLFTCGLLAAQPLVAYQGCGDDALEDNDTCQTALAIMPGDYSGLVLPIDDYDYYKVSVPTGDRLTFDVTTDKDFLVTLNDARGASDCGFGTSIFAVWMSSLAPRTFQWVNLSGASKDCIIGFLPAFECTHYELSVRVEADQCGALSDSGITGNYDCASAVTLGAGSYPGQFISYGIRDFVRLELQPAELVTLDLLSPLTPSGPPVRALVDQDCAPPYLGQSYGVILADRYRLHLFNQRTQQQTYTVEILLQPDPTDPLGFCSDYDLEISSQLDPNGIYAGDAFEPNDSCVLAAPIDDGLHQLSATVLNQDWFSLTVEPGATLSYLHSPTGGPPWASHLVSDCSGSFQAFLASANPLFSGSSQSVLTWKNTESAPREVRFFVIHPGWVPDFSTAYELDLRNTQGEVFCGSTPNSSGAAARIDASGSTDVYSGSLELSAVGLPSGVFGLFFFSSNEVIAAPFGNGLLCLGAPFRRLPVANSGPGGALHTTIDWAAPGSAGAITAGSTWGFQAWYRDVAGGGTHYNLSDGLRIEF